MAMTRQRTPVALEEVTPLSTESSPSVAPLEVFKRIPYSANAARDASARTSVLISLSEITKETEANRSGLQG
jgi:U3 small nucleolar ribonucleoprotein component